jgi:alkylhydroperoxidase family enzyme
MSNGYPQRDIQVVEAGFFDSVFAGALVVVLAELVLLPVSAFLVSDFVVSDFVAVVLLELLVLLSPDDRESFR